MSKLFREKFKCNISYFYSDIDWSDLVNKNNNISSVFCIYPRFKRWAYHVGNIVDYYLNHFSLLAGILRNVIETSQIVFSQSKLQTSLNYNCDKVESKERGIEEGWSGKLRP